MSHSSLNTYAECGEKWRLERIYGVPSESWYATVAGTAVHEITEHYDRLKLGLVTEDAPSFQQVFDREIAESEEKGVGLRVSGKKRVKASLDGGPNKKDYDWWLEFGPVMIDMWAEWRDESDWEIATMPDGSPGIEVDLSVDVAGRPFKGFIDRVFLTPNGQVVIVDLKTGALPPGQSQLTTYGVGLWRQHGLRAEWGAYWSGTSGQLSRMKDLTVLPDGFIDHQYEMAWRGIEAGVYLPNVTSMCVTCGVRRACRAFSGAMADRVEPFEPAFYAPADTSSEYLDAP